MMVSAIRFLSITLVALVAGTVFGIWIGYNPRSWSASTYLEQQQGAINGLNTLMPILGLLTIVLTLLSAYLQKEDKWTVTPLLIASAFLIVSGLITKFGNQPINKIVMTWTVNSMPGNWTELRDKWWSLHILRSISTLLSLLLIVGSEVKKGM